MKEYESLRQFAELARTLHFTRAAAALHVSPSALSRSIRRLEAQVGEPLFEREHHNVTLTDAGVAFRRYATSVLEGWSAFEAERSVADGPLHGTVHVYCTVTAAQTIVPELLARFRDRHPGVRLALATGYAADALDQLGRGAIDVTIAPLPSRLPRGVDACVVASTPVVVVGPTAAGPVRDLVSGRRIDWARVPYVLPERGLPREAIDAWLSGRGIEPQVYAEIQGHEAILSLVALGCGVGVVPELVLASSALQDRVAVLPGPRLPPLTIGLCVRGRSLSNPVVAALWDLAREDA
jgi:LysR family positive regulator for ilvC